VEDLILEFDVSPPNEASGVLRIQVVQWAINDALVPIVTGVVRFAGWTDDAGPAG